MKTFTAKTLHDNPSEVYRAAVKEPVKITHKHHGDFIVITPAKLADTIQGCSGITTAIEDLEECFKTFDDYY